MCFSVWAADLWHQSDWLPTLRHWDRWASPRTCSAGEKRCWLWWLWFGGRPCLDLSLCTNRCVQATLMGFLLLVAKSNVNSLPWSLKDTENIGWYNIFNKTNKENRPLNVSLLVIYDLRYAAFCVKHHTQTSRHPNLSSFEICLVDVDHHAVSEIFNPLWIRNVFQFSAYKLSACYKST